MTPTETDTALPELRAVRVGGLTRASFIARGAFAVAAAYGASAAGPYVARAFAQTATGDSDVLSFALTLESIESAFYKAALGTAKLPADLTALANELSSHEQQHVSALSLTLSQLGVAGPAVPATSFPVNDAKSFLRVAQSLEETGVSAYNGALAQLQSADLMNALASIAQVEARHAAAIRIKNGGQATTSAFDQPFSQAQALAALKPYVK